MKRAHIFILIIFLLSIPTFWQMLTPGIFSMQDFHLFRLIEFDKCIRALQIPCRWAPDAGAGYGEPVFNFYGQFVYVFGELFHLINFSKVDSLKITFIFSLVGSAISMFFLAKKIWKNNFSALVSSIVYLYAPYRAVDVWVRGALPEAFAFIFFPLIILFFEKYLDKRKLRDLLIFSLVFGFLICTHNLSVILFLPFLIIWIIFRFIQMREPKVFIYLFFGGILSFLLSAFYVLPVIFESKFVDINSTTVGYFDWRAHFVTIRQLFIERNWGYGGSTWGNEDGFSLAVGYVQYTIPIIAGVIIVLRRKHRESIMFWVLIIIGIIGLFLTHNKSTFIWNNLEFMKYIQFPWRFLTVSVFSLALASGKIVQQLENRNIQISLAGVVIIITILLNFNFFKPDIWYAVGDGYFMTGEKWTEAQFASIKDYWPNFKYNIPSQISDGKYINYFPGWNKEPNEMGLIVKEGAVFYDTPIRAVGNLISLFSIIVWIILFIKSKNAKNI